MLRSRTIPKGGANPHLPPLNKTSELEAIWAVGRQRMVAVRGAGFLSANVQALLLLQRGREGEWRGGGGGTPRGEDAACVVPGGEVASDPAAAVGVLAVPAGGSSRGVNPGRLRRHRTAARSARSRMGP